MMSVTWPPWNREDRAAVLMGLALSLVSAVLVGGVVFLQRC